MFSMVDKEVIWAKTCDSGPMVFSQAIQTEIFHDIHIFLCLTDPTDGCQLRNHCTFVSLRLVRGPSLKKAARSSNLRLLQLSTDSPKCDHSDQLEHAPEVSINRKFHTTLAGLSTSSPDLACTEILHMDLRPDQVILSHPPKKPKEQHGHNLVVVIPLVMKKKAGSLGRSSHGHHGSLLITRAPRWP